MAVHFMYDIAIAISNAFTGAGIKRLAAACLVFCGLNTLVGYGALAEAMTRSPAPPASAPWPRRCFFGNCTSTMHAFRLSICCAIALEKLHHFRQIVHLYGDSQLIFGLPGVVNIISPR